MNRPEHTIHELLELTEIRINGDSPHDIQVHNNDFYARVLSEGSIGFGESYMDGWWDCDALDSCIEKILRADLDMKVSPLKMIFPVVYAKIVNRQRRAKAYDIGKHHYDLGNDLYQLMLDKRMTYTCGYWQNAENLDQAQEAKLDLICRKIGLQKGMKVLDIGCGWGSFAGYAAEKYGAEVVGVTVSEEQLNLGKQLYKGLPVDLRYQDYRDVNESFDRIVSVGMFEHVGPKNYGEYMEVAAQCLVEGGLFLLHTIGANSPKTTVDPWTDKYIFPGGILPTPKQIMTAIQDRFILEDWHNFGADYDPTLMAWMGNVDANREALSAAGYDERFYRMWRYFLLSSAGSFRARRNQLWQIVLAKPHVYGRYDSTR